MRQTTKKKRERKKKKRNGNTEKQEGTGGHGEQRLLGEKQKGNSVRRLGRHHR